jgi:hypothetical protein
MRAYVQYIKEHKDAKFNESEYEDFEGTNNKWAWVAMAWVLHPHTSPHIPTHPLIPFTDASLCAIYNGT